jgi:hypothetical protein
LLAEERRLRVIDKPAGQKCTSKEAALSWSQQGLRDRPGRPVQQVQMAQRVHRGHPAQGERREAY